MGASSPYSLHLLQVSITESGQSPVIPGGGAANLHTEIDRASIKLILNRNEYVEVYT